MFKSLCFLSALLGFFLVSLLGERVLAEQYILYARPGGALGAQLGDFWKAIKSEKLNDPPVLEYPPHVTLTGFFAIKNSGKAQEDLLIASLRKAIAEVHGTIPIVIGSSITQTKSLDYIPLKSSRLRGIAISFLNRAGLDSSFIRPMPKAKLGYHITLRQDTQGSTTLDVQKLEKTKIKLKTPNLQKNTTWTLYLYKKTGKQLEILYQQPIQTQ